MPAFALKKTARIELRLSEEEKDIIVRAAKALGQDISSFLLSQVLTKAKETIMFENEWMQNEQSVKHLLQIVNAEPRDIPKLRELLTTKYQNEYRDIFRETEG